MKIVYLDTGDIIKHEMRLNNEPYLKIKKGTKTIESNLAAIPLTLDNG